MVETEISDDKAAPIPGDAQLKVRLVAVCWKCEGRMREIGEQPLVGLIVFRNERLLFVPEYALAAGP